MFVAMQTTPALGQAPPVGGIDARAQPMRWTPDEADDRIARIEISIASGHEPDARTALSPDQIISLNQVDVINPGVQIRASDIDQVLQAVLSIQRDAALSDITVGDALRAANEIAAVHRRQGYALVTPRIDDAALQQGQLNIEIHVPNLAVIQMETGSNSIRQSILESLGELRGRPVNTRELETRMLALASQNRLTSSFRILIDESDTGEAIAIISEQRPSPSMEWRASVSTDRSPAFGAIRSAGRIKAMDLALGGDEYSIEAGRGDGFNDWILAATLPLNRHDFELYGSGFLMEGELIELPLRDLNITNSIQSWTVGASAPVAKFTLAGMTNPFELTLGAELNFKRTELLQDGMPLSVLPGAVDGVTRYTALRLLQSLSYESGTTSIDLSSKLSYGVDALRGDETDSTTPDENFIHWYGEFELEHSLGPGLFKLRAAAQVSDGPLFGPEQYTLGGMYSVRGFRAHAIFADTAAFATLEYELPIFVETTRSADWLEDASLIFFADGGRARLAVDPQPEIREIYSLGLGTEIEINPSLTLSAFWAEQLRDGPDRVETNFQDDGFGFRIVLER